MFDAFDFSISLFPETQKRDTSISTPGVQRRENAIQIGFLFFLSFQEPRASRGSERNICVAISHHRYGGKLKRNKKTLSALREQSGPLCLTRAFRWHSFFFLLFFLHPSLHLSISSSLHSSFEDSRRKQGESTATTGNPSYGNDLGRASCFVATETPGNRVGGKERRVRGKGVFNMRQSSVSVFVRHTVERKRPPNLRRKDRVDSPPSQFVFRPIVAVQEDRGTEWAVQSLLFPYLLTQPAPLLKSFLLLLLFFSFFLLRKAARSSIDTRVRSTLRK